MKKNILIISLLAIFILGSFTFALASLLPQRDNVQFSETVLFGNPKAAEGLTINYKNHFDYHLFWDTIWTVGTSPESAVTDYRFSVRGDRETESADPAITLNSHAFDTYNNMNGIRVLDEAYEKMAADAVPNEEITRVVYLADYFEYYPMEVTLNLPGFNQREVQRPTQLAFQEFFKIPVLPGDTMELRYWLGTDGSVSTHSSYGTDTLFHAETESVLTEDTCYFTFTTITRGRLYVDTSLIPGGFGIYALPYSEEGIETDKLSMVYPLNSKAQIQSMYLSSDHTSLFLFTKEDSSFYFAEIALDTMETLQKVKLGVHAFYDNMLHVTDDYFAFYGADDNDVSGYRIFSRNESGQFKYDFLIPSPIDEGRNYFNFYSDATFAYDGDRAALTGLAVSASHWSCVFTVAVYDETGMLYCGEYSTGQNCREESQGGYNCMPQSNQMAEITWS